MSTLDPKLNQLLSWLDDYLNVSRSRTNKTDIDDTVLYFMCDPPNLLKFHCTTSDNTKLGLTNGEFCYNGPQFVSGAIRPQLLFMNNSVLIPVEKFSDRFQAALISINPEYLVGKPTSYKIQEVVSFNYVNLSGDSLAGPLLMPPNYVPTDDMELVTKLYVDKLRLDLEVRLGSIEDRVLAIETLLRP